MQQATPARLFALLAGGALAVLGVAGFFWGSSFDPSDRALRGELGEVLGIFAVNGPTNLVHLLTGLVGLTLATRAARTYALATGLLYIVLALWGMLALDRGIAQLLGLIAVDTADNLLHLAIGLAGVAAGAATPLAEPTRRPRARPG